MGSLYLATEGKLGHNLVTNQPLTKKLVMLLGCTELPFLFYFRQAANQVKITEEEEPVLSRNWKLDFT